MTDGAAERFFYRLVYSRNGPARFTSHQDSITSWERTFRRASLPLAYSQGYSPKPQLRFPPPLPVGHCGINEMLDFEFTSCVDLAVISEEMNTFAPKGLTILQARPAGPTYGKLTSEIISIDYTVTVEPVEPNTPALLADFLRNNHHVTEVTRGFKTKTIDLREAFISITLLNDQEITMTIAAGNKGNGRPEDILSLLRLAPVEFTRTGVHGPWDDSHR